MARDDAAARQGDDQGDEMSIRRMPFRFDPGFSMGHILTAASTLAAVVWLAATVSANTDANQRKLDEFRADVKTQILSLKADFSSQMLQMQAATDRQFSMVRSDIANLPGMKERVDQLDKRMDQSDSRYDAQSKRLDAIQQQGIQSSADLANLLRRQVTR